VLIAAVDMSGIGSIELCVRTGLNRAQHEACLYLVKWLPIAADFW
jgi:hypothetical protein